jgi:large repetitive protein
MRVVRWVERLERRLTRRCSGSRRHNRPAQLPAVERLEDRTLLAAFLVNSFADAADVNPGDGVADDGTGQTTLRAAIMEANALAGDDTITLPSGTYTLSVLGTGEDSAATGDLDVTDTSGKMTIIGAGAETTVIDASSIDRVFDLLPLAELGISGVTITNGSLSNERGGGIRNSGATLSVDACLISGNSASGAQGGGIASIANSDGENAMVTIANSTITENDAPEGAAVACLTWGDVGVSSTLVITDSAITDNLTSDAIYSYTYRGSARGDITISRCNISGNANDGIHSAAGYDTTSAVLTVMDCTICDNSGTGIYSRAGSNSDNHEHHDQRQFVR